VRQRLIEAMGARFAEAVPTAVAWARSNEGLLARSVVPRRSPDYLEIENPLFSKVAAPARHMFNLLGRQYFGY
jgi:hypothetical protein